MTIDPRTVNNSAANPDRDRTNTAKDQNRDTELRVLPWASVADSGAPRQARSPRARVSSPCPASW